MPRQLTLVDVASRRCPLCGSPFGRPNLSCVRCQLRRDPLPLAPATPLLDAADAAAAAAAAKRLSRLRCLGRRVRVGLIGCSHSKQPGVHAARELYTGGFFRRALPIAERTCDEVWVLSARHGLLPLDRCIAKYNAQLSARRTERALWGTLVITSLCNAYLELSLHLVFLAGGPYVEGITGYDQRTDRWVSFNAQALERAGWTYETPLRGLDRPARWAWFDAHGGASAAALDEGGDAPPVGDQP